MIVKQKTHLSHAVGRRKSSVARVYLSKGTGKIIVNHRGLKDYFPKGTNRYIIDQPMALLELSSQYDCFINVSGGGTTGQAGAIRLGISLSLFKINPLYKDKLRQAGFLTRDSRRVERKKPGQRGARARFQFSKR